MLPQILLAGTVRHALSLHFGGLVYSDKRPLLTAVVRPLCRSVNVHFVKLQCKLGQELLPLLQLAEPFASYELEP